MKKLIISALAFAMISFASVQAQTTSETSSQTQEVSKAKAGKQEKVAVKPENLPEGIKKTIKSEEFSGWKVTKAFLVTEPDEKQYYELSVAKGSESARVKLDKDGNNVG